MDDGMRRTKIRICYNEKAYVKMFNWVPNKGVLFEGLEYLGVLEMQLLIEALHQTFRHH